MSYQDQSYLEEVEIAEQDYKDDLEALKNAEKEMHDAYEWQKKMILKCNESAAKLSTLKSRD